HRRIFPSGFLTPVTLPQLTHLFSRNQLSNKREACLVDYQQTSCTIKRKPTPIGSARVAGILQSALKAGRCENATAPEARDGLAAGRAFPGRDAPGVLRFQPVGHEPRRGYRERLRR